MSDYQTFLASKRIEARPMGFAVDPAALNPALFPFQRAITEWSLKRGRAAIFAAVGLGKTPMQIEWAHHVHLHTGGDVLILAPLAVAQQTRREGLKFGRTVTVCRSQEDVRPGVNVTNYEMVEHFDAARFAGVVLDESACLRDYMGIVKRRLVDAFAATPYRLCCTATPAPNDHMELGNHSEFLGVMPAPEMLSRWFINDTNATGVYRLKGHAEADFWRWVTSWAVALRRPSDLGDYSDDGYILPPLTIHQHTVEVDVTADRGDHLFRIPDLSATAIHAEMRRTAPARAAVAAALVNGTPGPWAVWVNTNYEADAVTALLPDALEVRGSDSIAAKEARLGAFSDGSARVILTKANVAVECRTHRTPDEARTEGAPCRTCGTPVTGDLVLWIKGTIGRQCRVCHNVDNARRARMYHARSMAARDAALAARAEDHAARVAVLRADLDPAPTRLPVVTPRAVRARAAAVIAAVTAYYRLDAAALTRPGRGREVSEARQVACYLLRRDYGLTYSEIGGHLQRDHSTVMHGVERITTALLAADDGDPAVMTAVAEIREEVAALRVTPLPGRVVTHKPTPPTRPARIVETRAPQTVITARADHETREQAYWRRRDLLRELGRDTAYARAY